MEPGKVQPSMPLRLSATCRRVGRVWRRSVASEDCKPETRRLVGVLAGEDSYHGHGDDLQIEGQTPVSKIVEIILHALCDRSVPAPAVHLGPTSNPSLKHVA